MATIIPVGDTPALAAPPAAAPDVPADLALSQAGDLVATPYGDLATVRGAARLLQDLWLLAATPQGTVLGDPEYGDVFARLVGEPALTPAQAQARAQGLGRQVEQLHALRAAAGYPPGLGERISAVSVDAVAVAGAAVAVSLSVRTASGEQAAASVPLAAGGQTG